MPGKTRIIEIMTKDVYTVSVDDTIKKADEIMREENVRHVPVLDGKKLVGLITERSVMEYTLRKIYEFDDGYEGQTLNQIIDYKNIISKPEKVLFPEDSLKKAIELFVKYKIDCLPVVDWDNNLVGIVTSVDILLFINNIV